MVASIEGNKHGNRAVVTQNHIGDFEWLISVLVLCQAREVDGVGQPVVAGVVPDLVRVVDEYGVWSQDGDCLENDL